MRARWLLLATALGCPNHPPARSDGTGLAEATSPDATGTEVTSAEAGETLASDASDDAMALHHASTDDLLVLVSLAPDAGTTRADALLRSLVGPVPGRFNQGNPAIAQHGTGQIACLARLRDVVLQTDEQRHICHGLQNMVPIYKGGDATKARTCIDVFEFPDRACELPFVWGTPSQAQKICALEGKRLCTQGEWNLACRGDPEGKTDWTYAYGNDLDLSVCNTNKPHAVGPDGQWLCNARSAQTAWATCATETEPSGAFPRCRSRFGIYDQHGNVAEMMTRQGEDKVVYTQLKGSAFFYVDVARRPEERQQPGSRETYPDHCNYDPRWHVEVLAGALHSNYHLGFRCCLSL